MKPTEIQLANTQLANTICKEYMSREMSEQQIAEKHGMELADVRRVLKEQLNVSHTLIRERHLVICQDNI